MRRARAIITGRVQGVSYRMSTESEATKLGLTGWVRNLPDGAVELEAEGDEEQVAALLAWCKHGPPNAEVLGVVVEERTPTGSETRFATRR